MSNGVPNGANIQQNMANSGLDAAIVDDISQLTSSFSNLTATSDQGVNNSTANGFFSNQVTIFQCFQSLSKNFVCWKKFCLWTGGMWSMSSYCVSVCLCLSLCVYVWVYHQSVCQYVIQQLNLPWCCLSIYWVVMGHLTSLYVALRVTNWYSMYPFPSDIWLLFDLIYIILCSRHGIS